MSAAVTWKEDTKKMLTALSNFKVVKDSQGKSYRYRDEMWAPLSRSYKINKGAGTHTLSLADAVLFLKLGVAFMGYSNNQWVCTYFDSANKEIYFSLAAPMNQVSPKIVSMEPLT